VPPGAIVLRRLALLGRKCLLSHVFMIGLVRILGKRMPIGPMAPAVKP
jgi:hypothetical protein